jgi:hypothetical protein
MSARKNHTSSHRTNSWVAIHTKYNIYITLRTTNIKPKLKYNFVRIVSDVTKKRNSQKNICTALIKLARQFAIIDIKLK